MENDTVSPCLLKPLPPFKVCGPFGSCVNNTCICDKGWSIPSWTKLSRSDTCSENLDYVQNIYTGIFVLNIIYMVLLVYKVMKKFPTLPAKKYAVFFFSLFLTFSYFSGAATASYMKIFTTDRVAFFETVSLTTLVTIFWFGITFIAFIEVKKYADLQERFAQKLNIPNDETRAWVKTNFILLKLLMFIYPTLFIVSSVYQNINLLRLGMFAAFLANVIVVYLSQRMLPRTIQQVHSMMEEQKKINSAKGAEMLEHLNKFAKRTSGMKIALFLGAFPGLTADLLYTIFSGICAFIDIIIAFMMLVTMISIHVSMIVSLSQKFRKKKKKNAVYPLTSNKTLYSSSYYKSTKFRTMTKGFSLQKIQLK